MSSNKAEMATFAAGCFWGVEESFRKIPGVLKTQVGFTGGHLENPRYEDTHNSKSGHAESIELEFDPNKVSYEALLEHFFRIHDPTTKNRQGNDIGSQYRSAIFYHGEEQKKKALEFIIKVNESGIWKDAVSTEVSEAKKFWPAEAEHQRYLIKNPGGYDNHHFRPLKFEKKK